MTVRELIELLQTFPQDALVICTFCSDYDKIDPDDITLMEPKDGEGLINHHGHIMHLPKKWREDKKTVNEMNWEKKMGRGPGVPQEEPVLITAVHFKGN